MTVTARLDRAPMFNPNRKDHPQMSVLVDLAHSAHHTYLAIDLPGSGSTARPPGQMAAVWDSVMAIIKWGVLAVIGGVVTLGVGAIAMGAVTRHHSMIETGGKWLGPGIIAAALYGGVYALVSAVTG